VVQLRGGGEAFAVPAALNLSASGGQPLPGSVRQKMESFFGTSFADVRVHVGNQAPSIGALAFTHGSNLYFAPGQYNPTTAHGQQLLGHELTHVMQQRAGRVKNPFGSGVAVVQDRSLEAEADRLGQRAAGHAHTVQAKPVPVVPPPARRAVYVTRTAARGGIPGAVQRSAPVKVSGMVPVGNGSYRISVGAGGHEVGSVMVHDRGQAAIEVTDLAVDPSHRKQGFGGVLMASAMRAGLQLRKAKVVLASQDTGTGRLTAWYKNMGFVPTGANRLGYPVLEAPISRVVTGVTQGRMSATHTHRQASPLERGPLPPSTCTCAVQLMKRKYTQGNANKRKRAEERDEEKGDEPQKKKRRLDKKYTFRAPQKLTGPQATRFFDHQNYTCQIKLDGELLAKQSGAGDEVIVDDYEFDYDADWGKNPHVEDKAIRQFVNAVRKQRKKTKGKSLSVYVQAAPCRRCAKNLIKLAKYYEMSLRVKFSRITRRGRRGIRKLRRRREPIPIRLWTEHQRQQKYGAFVGGYLSTAEWIKKYNTKRWNEHLKTIYKNDDGVDMELEDVERVQRYDPDADKTWKQRKLSRTKGQWPDAREASSSEEDEGDENEQ
jgi:ribosomal protein S18 acetylase RimI-like enzyme